MRKSGAIIGEKINLLTVICEVDPIERKGKKIKLLNCICDCGKKIIVRSGNFKNGHTKSCGCIRGEINKTHGLSLNENGRHTRLYNIWTFIKIRCYNKKSKNFHTYGGRGIIMCDKWKNSYEEFHLWSISNGYKETLSIDRIDNNGNYCPDNCRWSTSKEQCNNKRNNVVYTFDGRTQTQKQWCDELGLNRTTVAGRIKSGWTIEQALTLPHNTKLKSFLESN